MSFEQEYYENDLFWSVDRASDRERARQTSEVIPDDVRTVLDVGCGNGILVNQLLENFGRFAHLCALDRSRTALKYVRTPKVCASIEALPFEDKSFDLVACLEVIEHLLVRVYDLALSELCRVSDQYVLISVPNDQNLRNTLVECPSCRSRFNPYYHMRSFKYESMQDLLGNFHFECIHTLCLGKEARYLRPFPSLLPNSHPYPGIPCPVCGHHLDGPSHSTSVRSLKQVIKVFWPRRYRYQWIVSLYARRGRVDTRDM